MDIATLLQNIWDHHTTPQAALTQLRQLPFENLGFAQVDYHRELRKGFPEVVFCPGKTKEQILEILTRIASHHSKFLATRASAEIYQFVKPHLPQASYHSQARAIYLEDTSQKKVGKVAVVSAGTADLPIAEEAALTAQVGGSKTEKIFDVGISGLHRLIPHLDRLWQANVIVVVAGMEGALPAVVAGMVGRPIIALPTSVGYGANFQGLAPLLTMLNSCVPGMATVNIDNGFGAGYMANLINQLVEGRR